MRSLTFAFVCALAACATDSGGGGDGGDGGGADDMNASGDLAGGGVLTISPMAPTIIAVSGAPAPTQQFTAYLDGAPTGVAWGVDRGEIGSINAAGLFTATGNVAGTANVYAVYGALKASTTITVQIQLQQIGDPTYTSPLPPPGTGGYGGVGGDGPAPGASAGQITTLDGSATVDSAVSLIYPYDATVWPRGLLAPLLQWRPGAHSFDSAYIHIVEKNFEYKGYFAKNATNFSNLMIPQSAWDQMTYSNGGEPVTVSITFAEGGSAYGPYTQTWTIAQATLKGTIYYNSYGTYLVSNSDGNDFTGHRYGAGTLQILPGATAPTLVGGIASGNGTGCRVCHTVSGDGRTLVTQASNANASNYADTRYINLAADATAGSGTSLATQNLAYPALSKDGALLLSSSGGMINGDSASRLYDLPAGALTASVSGLPASFRAALPAFSPDDKHVAFNYYGGTLAGLAAADQKSLGMLDFDRGGKIFSGGRVLYTPPSGVVSYSSWIPSGAGVVFETELASPGGFGFTRAGNTGELWWVDTSATPAAHRLDRANGWNVGGATSYLPDTGAAGLHPTGLDTKLNYEPTVNPIASGGYAWVVFTSRRMYGNVAAGDPYLSDPRDYNATTAYNTKKLWVAAIDLSAAPGSDPSHPAFYLPAQEIHAGNARGFWTVEQCHPDGDSCMTGDECCGGYCQPSDGGLVCSSTTPVCAAEFERCTVDGDCCDSASGIKCINNICTLDSPPIP